jgi:periplasmic mercuric ion binding protein
MIIMKNLKRVLVVILLMSFVVLTARAQEEIKEEAAATIKVDIKISGMTCTGCASSVSKVLSEISGVVMQEVKYPGEIAVVTYDPKKTNPKDLVATIEEETNFTAEVQRKKEY